MAIRVPRIRTGTPELDLVYMICWYCMRDYVHGTYKQYRSARYFFTSEKSEFDGMPAEYYFDICGLDREACHDRARKLRKEKYRKHKEPAAVYTCCETRSDGKRCGRKFFTFEEYRRHLKVYKHTRKLCDRPGCNNLAKIKYCSSKCYWKHRRMKQIPRYPAILREPTIWREPV